MYTAPGTVSASLTTAAATTTGFPAKFAETSVFTIYAAGTWGSGTLKLQGSPSDSGTSDYQDIPSITWTADGVKTVSGYFARRFRFVLTGSTAATVTATVVGLGAGITVS